jgi:hypothetical protein
MPDDLHRRVKDQAAAELRSMNSMLVAAIRRGLAEMERREVRDQQAQSDNSP